MFVEDQDIARQIRALAAADAQEFLTKSLEVDTGIPPPPEIKIDETSAEPVKFDFFPFGQLGATAQGPGGGGPAPPPTGACCVGATCYEDTSVSDCADLGGEHFPNSPCSPNPCCPWYQPPSGKSYQDRGITPTAKCGWSRDCDCSWTEAGCSGLMEYVRNYKTLSYDSHYNYVCLVNFCGTCTESQSDTGSFTYEWIFGTYGGCPGESCCALGGSGSWMGCSGLDCDPPECTNDPACDSGTSASPTRSGIGSSCIDLYNGWCCNPVPDCLCGMGCTAEEGCSPSISQTSESVSGSNDKGGGGTSVNFGNEYTTAELLSNMDSISLAYGEWTNVGNPQSQAILSCGGSGCTYPSGCCALTYAWSDEQFYFFLPEVYAMDVTIWYELKTTVTDSANNSSSVWEDFSIVVPAGATTSGIISLIHDSSGLEPCGSRVVELVDSWLEC